VITLLQWFGGLCCLTVFMHYTKVTLRDTLLVIGALLVICAIAETCHDAWKQYAANIAAADSMQAGDLYLVQSRHTSRIRKLRFVGKINGKLLMRGPKDGDELAAVAWYEILGRADQLLAPPLPQETPEER
jgi:hypothetical protein